MRYVIHASDKALAWSRRKWRVYLTRSVPRDAYADAAQWMCEVEE